MYVHIFGYLVNKLEIWWVYLSPIEQCFPRKTWLLRHILNISMSLVCAHRLQRHVRYVLLVECTFVAIELFMQ